MNILMKILPVLFLVLSAPSCETGRGEIIPYVKVDIKLLLYADLAYLGIGTSKLIPGGVSGIVLYRESELDFLAFDRTCTQYPLHEEAVVEDPDFFGVFTCPECGSSFLLMNGGQVNKGPASHALVQYNTSLRGDVLHIFN